MRFGDLSTVRTCRNAAMNQNESIFLTSYTKFPHFSRTFYSAKQQQKIDAILWAMSKFIFIGIFLPSDENMLFINGNPHSIVEYHRLKFTETECIDLFIVTRDVQACVLESVFFFCRALTS